MCKNHAHLILGNETLENLPSGAFSWPLFTQEEIELLYRARIDDPSKAEREKEMLSERLSRICVEVKKQKRNSKGRFGGSFLPKSARFHLSSIDMGMRPGFWFDFAEGKHDICLLLHNSPLGPLLGALHDCSLIDYETLPSKKLFRNEQKLEGKCVFRVPKSLTVIE